MSYSYQRISVRPTLDVSFYPFPAGLTEYIQITYTDTGKLVSTVTEYTDGNLIQVRTNTFSDIAAWEEYTQDPLISSFLAERNQYELENGIVVDKVIL